MLPDERQKASELMADQTQRERAYTWRIGDVFTDGRGHYWEVDAIVGDRAVLRSCSSTWATTKPLLFHEWHDGHRWTLVEAPHE